jgi:peptidoglycan/xylan/chitin deacetylase (PgdA/CDA1 family)
VQAAGELLARSRSWPMERKDELADALWAASAMPPLAAFLDEHRPYFSWAELDEWVARGHGVGLHTRTHPICSALKPEQVEDEIEKPAAELRDRFGLEALPFSYPFGVRLPQELEHGLVAGGVVSCALGIHGFAPAGSPPARLERANAEAEFRFSVFGRPFLGLPRRGQDSPMEGV